jgi:pimeloyl-ACP methyl ester carboxylesterase
VGSDAAAAIAEAFVRGIGHLFWYFPGGQRFLRERQPRTLIFWGQEDIFFTAAGGEAYLADLPNAELHRLAAGHFAVEDHLEYIAYHMGRFFEEQ